MHGSSELLKKYIFGKKQIWKYLSSQDLLSGGFGS